MKINEDHDIIQFIIEKLNIYPEIFYNNIVKDHWKWIWYCALSR